MYIEIVPSADGSHAFQIGGALENGWAVVPPDMELPDSFPYVDIEVGEVTISSIDGGADIVRMEVLSMTEGEKIQVDEPIAESEKTVWEELDAAYQEGVNSV